MNTRWNFSFDSTIVGWIHPEKKFPASRERDCQGMEDLFRMDAARSQKVLKWHNSFPYFFFSFVAMYSFFFLFLNLQINIKWIQTVPQTFYDTEEAAWEWRWPRKSQGRPWVHCLYLMSGTWHWQHCFLFSGILTTAGQVGLYYLSHTVPTSKEVLNILCLLSLSLSLFLKIYLSWCT